MSDRQTFEEKCRRGLHPFDRLFERGPEEERAVVHWCPVCGTISIDKEVDGRIGPGAFVRARRPRILERQTQAKSANDFLTSREYTEI